jgi:hypothetical protein
MQPALKRLNIPAKGCILCRPGASSAGQTIELRLKSGPDLDKKRPGQAPIRRSGKRGQVIVRRQRKPPGNIVSRLIAEQPAGLGYIGQRMPDISSTEFPV